MDPLSIIGAASAIVALIEVVGKIIGKIGELRDRWRIADLTIFTFETQLGVFQEALIQIQIWTDNTLVDQHHHNLVIRLERCITCCRILVTRIDDEMSQLETTGGNEVASKAALLFATQDMKEIQRMIEQQSSTLTLLLTACNANVMNEQKKLLEQPHVLRAFRTMDEDAASLIVHRDADSIKTTSALSFGSSKWSIEFAFDSQLFMTKVYDKWIRAATRKPRHLRLEQQDTSATTAVDNTQPIRSSSVISSQSPQSLRRKISRLRQNAADNLSDIERTRQTREASRSQEIDASIRADQTKMRREIQILLHGSKSRRRLIHSLRERSGVYRTGDKLDEHYPLVLETLIKCFKLLVVSFGALEPEANSNALVEQMDCISLYELDSTRLTPKNLPSPQLVAAILAIQRHPASASLLKQLDNSHSFMNVKYFYEEASRIVSPTYIPHDIDVSMATASSLEMLDVSISMGQLNCRILDFGSISVSGKIIEKHFDKLTSIIFVVDVCAYYQINEITGEYQNVLLENMSEFDALVNLKALQKCSIILLFVGAEKLKKQMAKSGLGCYFPDYSGGNDVNKAVKYILWRYNLLNRQNLDVYPHITNLYDSATMVWNSIKDTILNQAMRASGISEGDVDKQVGRFSPHSDDVLRNIARNA